MGCLGDDAEVVRDQDDRGAYPLLQVAQELEDLGLDSDVQRRGWLVGDQDLGVARQRYGYDDPLAHPPENWCGYCLTRSSAFGMPTISRSSGPLVGPGAGHTQCFFRLSVIWRPTLVGSSEVMGSWKTIAILGPRTSCICFSDRRAHSASK